jgi:hypothetical protein
MGYIILQRTINILKRRRCAFPPPAKAGGIHARSYETAGALLGFLGAQEGDVDPDYFKGYTKAQLEFVERYGEELKMWSEDLETGGKGWG